MGEKKRVNGELPRFAKSSKARNYRILKQERRLASNVSLRQARS
jgi:hypothetical protein